MADLQGFDLRAAIAETDDAIRYFEQAIAPLSNVILKLKAGRAQMLKTGPKQALNGRFNAVETELPPAAEHRRKHRSGRVPKIDADPELAAFLEVRIDRMTFQELAAAVREAFPKERWVAKSSIHLWWSRSHGK